MTALPCACFLCGQRTVDEATFLDHFLRAHCWPYDYWTHDGKGRVWCWCGNGLDVERGDFLAQLAAHFNACGGLQAHYAEMLLNLDGTRDYE